MMLSMIPAFLWPCAAHRALRRWLLLGVSVLSMAYAPTCAAASALEQLREFASSTRAARGEFTQVQALSNGRSGASSSGTFAFIRPGRFRWEVTRPIEQVIVTDGERVHFYDKDLRQVTVRKMNEAIGSTPAAILFGSNDLEANFIIKDAGAADGLEWLTAQPRSKESGFELIRIGFKAGLPEAMDVRDAFGQTTRFTFRAIERNPALDQGLFRFVAPKGVDVIQ
jgi:outer membrane lipoprotein carrier protein